MIASALRWARAWRVLVLSAAALATVIGLIAVRGLTFDADVLHLLPRHGRAVLAFEQFLQRFGSLDYLYIVFDAPDGHTIEEYDDRIRAFVTRLTQLPEIERVDAGLFGEGQDWGYLADRTLLMLSPNRVEEALARFTPARLPAEVDAARELLSVPSPDIAALVRQDPLGLLALMRDQLQGAAASLTIDPSRGGYVTKDGRSRLVLARPVRPPFDIDFSKQLFARLAELEREAEATSSPPAGGGERGAPAAGPRAPSTPADRGTSRDAAAQAAREDADADDEPLPPMRIEFAGGHRISLETEREVRRETVWNSVGSLAVILPLLFIAFRSPWLVAVGALPSALAILVVLAIYSAAGVTLTAAATGAAAMLFGLGIDGVVLMFVAFRQQISDGRSPDEAVAALGGPASSMLLGMWTTAATFYGLTILDFPSLEELGALIGHGMVLCGVLTLILVPALLPRRVTRRAPPLTAWWLARFVIARSRAILVGAVLVTLALGLAAMRLRVDASLEKLKATSAAADLEQQIAARFGLPRDVYLVIARGPDLDAMLADNERVVDTLARTRPSLVVYAPTTLLPSQARQARTAARIQAAGLSAADVATRLQAAAREAGFREDTFQPFLERLPRLLDANERLTYDGFRGQGLVDVLGRTITREVIAGGDRASARADATSTAGTSAETASRGAETAGRGAEAAGRGANANAAASARTDTTERARAGAWVLATYLYPTSDEDVRAVRAAIEPFADRMTLTGLPEVDRELAARFTPEFLKGLALGTALVVGLIVLSFRRLDLTLLALVPTFLALLWAAGLLGLARIELDLFSVFAVMTFVGIGVDYGIHMVHRFQHASERDGDIDAVIAQLGPVILVAGGITLLGFGTLVSSSYPPLHSLGLISIVMVTTLMGSSLLVLPALLVRKRRS